MPDARCRIIGRIGVAVALFVLFQVLLLKTANAGNNRWTSNGPYGGFVSEFTFHPQLDNLLFVRVGSAFRSRNGGLAWERLGIGQGDPVIRVHPRDPGTILGANFALWKSTDQGANWTRVGGPQITTGGGFRDLEMDPQDPRIIYGALGNQGIAKSTDGGGTWAFKNSGLPIDPSASCCGGSPQIEVDPTNGKNLYALLLSGKVFRSTNGGDSWTSATAGLKFATDVQSLTMDPKNPQIIYAGGFRAGIFKTTNGGKQWVHVNCDFCASLRQITLDPRNSQTVYVAANEISRSTDGGDTWTQLSAPNYPFFAIGVHPRKNLLFGGAWGAGVFRSADGGHSFQSVISGLSDEPAMQIASTAQKPSTLFTASASLLWQSTNGGQAWQQVKSYSSDSVDAIRIHPANPNLMVGVGFGINISRDGGKTWEHTSPFDSLSSFRNSQCLALHPTDQNTMFVTPYQQAFPKMVGIGIAKSTDQGKNWKLVNSGLSDKAVQAIVISASNPSVLYAGTRNGKVFKSVNGGSSWKAAGTLLGKWIWSIAIDPANPDIVYAGAQGSLYKTTDGGRKWAQKMNGLPSTGLTLFVVTIHPRSARTVFAGGVNGLFVSADAGETWSSMDTTGLPAVAVEDFYINPSQPDTFVAGTDQGTHFFTRTVSSAGPVVEQLAPAAGKVGDVVVIAGRNFGTIQGDSKVSFAGMDAGTASSWSDARIQVKAPSGVRTGGVTVTVAGKKSNPYEFIVLPSSGNVEPTSGPSSGGTRVTILAPSGISGTQFNVLFGSTVARDIRFTSPNIITCTSPPGSGTVDVSVTSSAVVAKVGTFTYQ
jgi:photosystem II stability/assembly factor-like uncharacterized protein